MIIVCDLYFANEQNIPRSWNKLSFSFIRPTPGWGTVKSLASFSASTLTRQYHYQYRPFVLSSTNTTARKTNKDQLPISTFLKRKF